MKVLVIRFSSIGDIVLTTPVVRCLKQQLADVEVHYLTKKTFTGILKENPYIDKVIGFDTNLKATIRELKNEHYDYVIDLHRNMRTLSVKRALDTISYSFPKLNFKKWLYVNLKVNLMPDKSIVDRYMKTIRLLGVKNDGKGLDYFLSEEDTVTSKDIPMSHWAGYVACVIGGSYFTKKLPVEQWKKFCAEFKYPLILLGGPEDREEGDEIAKVDPIRIYNACGKFSLNESASLVKFSKLVISNDTGLMHIAAAFKKKVISLWGNTTPEMGMFSYYGYNNLRSMVAEESIVLENRDLGCRPCSKLGYRKCPKGHFKCMNDLNMSNLAEIARKNMTKPNQSFQ